ncbi:MAG TPA: serine/threonine-protein kinase, partial [Kofleriaceae bacterium]|nr:serine/threonine-protein kinase [Kofleriaceae bacterium]
MTQHETSLSDPLSVGDRVLDRYRIVERLETGGTSVVYRGEDERLSRPVCIKVFHTLRDKEWIYRTTYQHFVQEAFALSKLSHPNTLRIYDFAHLPGPDGEEEGAPFQVSEYMNGGTLSNLVRREGPLAPPEAGQVVTAICGALDEAHTHDIIHRDIKPKNILFGTAGKSRSPKLADFGIAKSLSIDSAALTNRAGDTHVVAGRRLLMYSGLWAAPEQLVGQPVGPASDIYSFALVTIYMLTGRCVFSSNDPSEAYRQRVDSDVLIDEVLAETDFPPSVAVLLKQACSISPDVRPERASSFARRLTEAFEGRQRRRMPLSAPPSHLTPVPDPHPGEDSRSRLLTEPDRDSQATSGSHAHAAPLGPTPQTGSGPPQRLIVGSFPQPVGDRTGLFVAMDQNGAADVTCVGGRARVRVSLVPAPGGFTVHVRGLSCFVRKKGGRASGATQLEGPDTIELVSPNQQIIGSARVHFGNPAAGHNLYPVG